ncbi:hypothetical protein [Winslowiella iniecta]|uniref:Uncharacterized protein n=1 Tax=Winslowiella iniecta TaxID=1560201 RepID=A0A0L7T976_9GAMM|nr:hypothetical protein [Winslowiella iniecta]KOC91924.1 hypothetical protein NG42_03995 [Winslowiella iniecta]KOC94953.1 hypothetical protein NG43_01715 [Winslowiella iniecta]
MTRSDEEKLTDIMMGEAVLALIRADGVISNAALIHQLQLMAKAESDGVKRRACQRAINEVRASQADSHKRVTHEIRGRDNVVHLFTSDGPADGTKKH